MHFLTDDSIMNGGKGKHTFTWALVSILYLAVSITLWWVYYFYFKDRRRIGQTEDNNDKSGLWGGATGTFIGFAIIAILLFLTGKFQGENDTTSPWYREYILVPIAWLSIGTQLGLVLSFATPDDWNKLKQEAKNKL